jgi:hypothetical protein
MGTQNRIYLTLSPRMRKALELCATLDSSSPATYAATLISSALAQEIEKRPALRERWIELEREALLKGSWDGILLPGVASLEVRETIPPEMIEKGWTLAGDSPHNYVCDIDEVEQYQGKPSGYIQAKSPDVGGFGTLMQMFFAEKYLNKRLRFSAMVKAESVKKWAGLWMRVDGPENQALSFDNMQNRPIRGTTDWRPCEVILDVPANSVTISFGLLLDGPGQAWINAIQFAEVGADVKPTAPLVHQEQPADFDFASKS